MSDEALTMEEVAMMNDIVSRGLNQSINEDGSSVNKEQMRSYIEECLPCRYELIDFEINLDKKIFNIDVRKIGDDDEPQ